VNRHPHSPLPPVQLVTERVLGTLERFLHVEAASGVALLAAAAVALVWANSPAAVSYHALWHAPLAVSVGTFAVERSLEFWINDALMTVFFLVVGLEIRRELHEGTLANLRLAALPLIAALGGVVLPALIYLAVSNAPQLRAGWAVPTATDIAFAVGVLALLGKSVPAAVRVLLLSIAVIDDLIAVLVIGLFYSGGFEASGLLLAAIAIAVVLSFQRMGLRSAIPYVLPGVLLWLGLLETGVHPTLAGVILGLLTPALPLRRGKRPLEAVNEALSDFDRQAHVEHADVRELAPPLRQLKHAQRDLLPPGIRLQMALHPWVAYGVMPLFALANAGIELGGSSVAHREAQSVAVAVFIALVIGKPAGILAASWLGIKLRWCELPADIGWRSLALVGCLGGIGFTMAVFIATLAFPEPTLLAAAKLGVLVASATAGAIGLLLGAWFLRDRRRSAEMAAKRT
jgi:NhaA family Na+:H+ antiporter